MIRIGSLGTAAAFVLFTACGGGDREVNVSLDTAAGSVESAAGAVGNAVDGATQTAQIKTAMAADSLVRALDINVDSNGDTKTVTLTGTVDTQAQKDRAEQIAKEQAQGWTVVNNLTVRQ